MDNIFGDMNQENPELLWENLLNMEGRKNLGDQMPVAVYRMFEYSMRDVLISMFGREKMIEIIRAAGERAGKEFYDRYLDGSLPLNDFLAQVQQRLIDFKVGILRIERFDEKSGHAIVTVSEDLDCSGLPIMGETVCNYDEGFIGGILKAYTGANYQVVEIDCWATGARVCRFEAQITSDE